MHRPRLYLAGPTVFRLDAKAEGERLKLICAAQGCEGLYPLDHDLNLSAGGMAAVRAIFTSCRDMIGRADAIIADLSPFRGPHCDDGTALEIGLALARGLPVFGYSTDRRMLVERITNGPIGEGAYRDGNGMLIEDFSQPFNAMIAGSVEAVFDTAGEAIISAAATLRSRGITSTD